MRVLLTNDDGIEADGLQTLRRALLAVPDVSEVVVVAPDGNRSAMARSITTRRPLWVETVDFGDGTCGYATDGTPVDCVRLASLGLVEGFTPDVVVSGINHGVNIGDDITYSGTVAAAFEGALMGIPSLAVSQQSVARDADFRAGAAFDFELAATFTADIVGELDDVPLRPGTVLNINVPAGEPNGVAVTRMGKRIYNDRLHVDEHDGPTRTRYWVYGDAPTHDDEPGTDVAAVAAGTIAVTPLHLNLTDTDGLDPLALHDLSRLLAPAVEEVE